jgi:hypothetical protein
MKTMENDYNTMRKHLTLPEYGRHIHKMVDHVVSIEDREERNRAAKAIITVMGNLNPHLRDIADFKHKLWDHLALMADFKLDIDWPYPLPTVEVLQEPPRKVDYSVGAIKYKHYGKLIEKMALKAAEMPDGEEKQALISILANLMKKFYLSWNREAVNDEVIYKDLYVLSKGKITIGNEVRLSDTRDLLSKQNKFVKKRIIPSNNNMKKR